MDMHMHMAMVMTRRMRGTSPRRTVRMGTGMSTTVLGMTIKAGCWAPRSSLGCRAPR